MHYIIVGPKGDNSATKRGAFAEIVQGAVDNAVYISSPTAKSRIHKMMVRLGESHRIPLRLRRRFVAPWEVGYARLASLLKPNEDNCIIFAPSVRPFHRVSPSLLRKLRRRQPGCKLILLMTDSIERVAWGNDCAVEELLSFIKRFDAALTYDRHDAEEYHCAFVELPLWYDASPSDAPPKYDLFFCGRPKQREALINAIVEKLQSVEGTTFQFIISGEPTVPLNRCLSLSPWRRYDELAADIKKSRCILEILADMNTGGTLRYKEAILYNKKLLTNNPDLPNLPYYNPRWMKYFRDASDIDVEWLRRDDAVDYEYKGDFSAGRFLEAVETVMKEAGLLE